MSEIKVPTIQRNIHFQIQHKQVQAQQQQQQRQQAQQINLQHIQQQYQQEHQQHQHKQRHHQQISNANTQLTLATPCTKKRRITFSDNDDNIYTAETVDYAVKDDQTIVKTSDMMFLRGSVKLDMPEYIVCCSTNEASKSVGKSEKFKYDGP